MKLMVSLMTALVLASASGARATPVAAQDILAQFVPGISLSQQAFGNVQCYGLIIPSQTVPEQGINGTPLPQGGTLRFGRVPDPVDTRRWALRFTLMPTDPLTAGSYRCETAFNSSISGLPRGRLFWHAYSVYLPDWRSTNDEQQLAQWHAGDTSGLQPIYALLSRDGQMRLVMRTSSSPTPTPSTVSTQVLWSTNSWVPNQWITVVTQALVSTDPAASPFIRTWINGSLVVNYKGPVGYNQPTAQPYVKHGIYHWTNLNPWDMHLPQRNVLFRRAALVLDPNRSYTAADLGLFVNTP
ncbi:MAG: hypothetical protein EBT24_11070 [Betaproteobacteria bacterium]|nr:hypothetical protein [Betaproteobacteria bacterium]NBT11503.1 hypothetical protein [Betaproteobacteria bacterium]NBX96907.1 hypothetical protein [Betaproteobacteria bacterium]